jgi:hypothetical protein
MLPNAKDISPTSGLDLDERCALEHFLGLDHAAALEMFRRDSEFLHVYLGDFVHMGESAFNYYMASLLQYLDELPDDGFVDEAPEVADYLLIRYPKNENLTAEMKNFIGHIHKRLQSISVRAIPSFPNRLASVLATYEEAEHVVGGNGV